MIGLLEWIQEGTKPEPWANTQNIHPVALVLVVILSFAMLTVPRRWAVSPFAVIIAFITVGQRFLVAGLDLPMLRVLIFVGWLRVIMRSELSGFRFRGIDALVVAWGVSQFCTHAALAATTFPGALGNVLIYRCGWLVDNMGSYFLFRALVRRWEDLETAVKLIAVAALPVALFFLVEKSTGRNLFSMFGGVAEITMEREGKLRCQGSFQHPILAGCFWAGLLPLFLALRYSSRPWRARSAAAIVCGMVVVICCASSTPVIGVFVAIVGIAMFPFRGYLRLIQVGIPILLLVLHLSMKAPVWHLLARIDLAGGSTGYHRYKLIDNAIRHANEWWLFGTPSTAHWGHQMFDITNHYVLQGVNGGLCTLLLFVAVLVAAFRGVGRLLRLSVLDRRRYMLAWLLGVSLLSHAAMLIAVSYFGKPLLLLTLTIAAIPSLELAARSQARRRAVLAAIDEEELDARLEPQSS